VIARLDLGVGALGQRQRRAERAGFRIGQDSGLRLTVVCDAVIVQIQEDGDIGAFAGRGTGKREAGEFGRAVAVGRAGIRAGGQAET